MRLPLLAAMGLIGAVCASAEGPMMRQSSTRPEGRGAIARLLAGEFRWNVSGPLIGPASRPADPCYAIKDPTVVFHDARWHVFCTIRSRSRTHAIEYLSFTDWKDADKAPRHVLTGISSGYFCAPQVFWFAPHKKWYMLYQASDKSREPAYGPALSSTTDIADPASWSKPDWLEVRKPEGAKAWLDFWIICDESHAYLFFTSLDGKMWRMATRLADFPKGWGQARVALQGDVFEASHTYSLKGLGKYLTLIEAEDKTGPGRRYYKAYIADRLDGEWKPLAATRETPFAGPANTRDSADHWTDSFSHGELLRSGIDQRLEVDPSHLRFLIQGVTDQAKAGKNYGDIPWRLGLLEPAP